MSYMKNMKSSGMLGLNPKSQREENDFYATNPDALILFLDKLQKDNIILNHNIWECACGMGHLSKTLKLKGYEVLSTDLINRNYNSFDKTLDFLKQKTIFLGDIITNPPFKLAEDFVKTGMSLITNNNKLILFLKIQFLESKKRKDLFKQYPPKYIYCHSTRQQCSMNADFIKYNASTQFYAWFIWENKFKGDTIIRWI